MDKIKFNDLSETEKVHYILQLNKKSSLSEISNILGIKKSSIKFLMDKYDYTFNGKTFLKHKDVSKVPKASVSETSVPTDRLYALEMRIFELETIMRNINNDLQNHKVNHQNSNATAQIASSFHEKIVFKDSVIDTLNTFLESHPALNKNEVVNKAILEYIENYHRLVLYSKKDIK